VTGVQTCALPIFFCFEKVALKTTLNAIKRHIYFATCDVIQKNPNYVTVCRSMSRPVSF